MIYFFLDIKKYLETSSSCSFTSNSKTESDNDSDDARN